MSRITPESRLTPPADRRVADINREFLRLATHPALQTALPVLGLDPSIRQGLRQLSPAAIDNLAAAPVLLAEFQPLPGTGQFSMSAIADQVADQDIDRGWLAERRAFADRLLTCLWQAASAGDRTFAFSAGPNRAAGLHYRSLGFAQIRRYRDEAAECLRARLASHPHCWADLIRGACTGSSADLATAHLSLIPLTVGECRLGLALPARVRYP